jgi:hypothetical protein
MRARTANWFICKVRYEKVMEDGLQKKVLESYVVDAMTFTEAEARIAEEMSHYINGEFDVVEIDRCVFKEVFFMNNGEKILGNETEKLSRAFNKGREAAKEQYEKPIDFNAANVDTRWYKAKLQFITIDAKTEKEKRSSVYYLVEGVSFEDARNNIDVVMNGTMIDYIISGVNETKILDVFEYNDYCKANA